MEENVGMVPKPSVRIGGSHLTSSEGEKPYTVYEVEVTHKGRVYLLEKRYSQFHKLNERLIKRYGENAKSIGKLFPGKMLAHNLSPARVDQRHMKLCTWMTAVLEDPQLCVCRELLAFLAEEGEEEEASLGTPQIMQRLRSSTNTWTSSSQLQSIGTLYKRKGKRWLLRFFVFRGDVLYKYNSPTSKNPISQHTISEETEVRILPKEVRFADAPHEFQFTLSIRGDRETVYAAASIEEMEEWVSALSHGKIHVLDKEKKTIAQEKSSSENSSAASASPTPDDKKVSEKRTSFSSREGKEMPSAAKGMDSSLRIFGVEPHKKNVSIFFDPLLQHLSRNAPAAELLFAAEDYNVDSAVKEKTLLENRYKEGKSLALGSIPPPTQAGLLLLWLFELPEPLIDVGFGHCFLGALQIKDIGHGHSVLLALLSQLPRNRLRALGLLMKFLSRVQRSSSEAWFHQLCGIFGPLLLQLSPEVVHWKNFEADTAHLVSLLAKHVDILFLDHASSSRMALARAGRPISESVAVDSNLSTKTSNIQPYRPASQSGVVQSFRQKYSMLVRTASSSKLKINDAQPAAS